VLTSFKKDKIPGPNGWIVELFLGFFGMLGDDLLRVVEEMSLKGIFLGSIDPTSTSLIPKVDKPVAFDEFQHIVLCNCVYKIISKVIAMKLKIFLSTIMSPNNLAFLNEDKYMKP
jgi:hypothetical protein